MNLVIKQRKIFSPMTPISPETGATQLRLILISGVALLFQKRRSDFTAAMNQL